jgi:hypothetical protein
MIDTTVMHTPTIVGVVFLVWALPYFYLLNMHVFWLAVLAEVIGFGFVFGFGYGAIPAFYTESFPTRFRASGASAAYQISQVYGGGIPIIAGLILHVERVRAGRQDAKAPLEHTRISPRRVASTCRA